MRTLILAAGLAFLPAAVYAQDSPVSSPAPAQSSTQDAAPADPAAAVSLDRIREGLARTAPLQETMEKQPTFRVEVQEKNPFDELLATLDLKHYPPVPGGLYALEQQRLAFNPVDHPLVQPYAAFSGPELITIAVENLVAKYLGRMAADAISSADRTRAENAARAEVAGAIARYCAALPGYGAGESLCSSRVIP